MFSSKVKAKYCIAYLDKDQLEELVKIVKSWADGSYDPDDIEKIKKFKIPDKYRTPPEILYRGEYVVKEELYLLANGKKVETHGISWTTDKKTARHFAQDHGGLYGVVWKYKPQKEDIILDVDLFASDHTIELPYKESEVLLKERLEVSKNDLVAIYDGKDPEGEKYRLPSLFMNLVKEPTALF